MNIRLATLDDLPVIAELGAQMHAESSFLPMRYDRARVQLIMGQLINEKQFVVVAENINGDIVGGMAGQCVQSWFGPDMVALDIALFVASDSRGGLRAVQLIQAFVSWARLAGARQVRPGVGTGNVRADDLYAALGFSRVGSHFVMDLTEGE